MSSSKDIVLITGGNAGIGLGVVRELLHHENKHVIIASRSLERGNAALAELQALKLPGSAEVVQLDVTDEASINAAAKEVEARHGRLDVLINNAGVARVPGDLSYPQLMLETYRVNVIGPYLVTTAFTPLLQAAKSRHESVTPPSSPRIINVSSSVGSIGMFAEPPSGYKAPRGMGAVHYCASKSALNMFTAIADDALGKDGIPVFAVCPGLVQTNFGKYNTKDNGAKPVGEGAAPIVQIALGRRDGRHGRLSHGPEPWMQEPEEGVYPW